MPPLSPELQQLIENEAINSANQKGFNYPPDNWSTTEVAVREYTAGFEDGATAYAHYKEEAERYRKALERIKDNILLQGPKEVAIDNRLHMIIYSSLHTAQAALNPPAGDNTKTEDNGK